jgi:signal transduction histidine kinase
MSFERLSRATRTVGFRLTVWSSSFFVVGSLALFGLAYVVVSSSLRERDDDAIRQESTELAAQYGVGGVPMLAQHLEHEERLGTDEPFLVRIVAPDGAVLFLGTPERWSEFELDHLGSAATRLDLEWISLRARRTDKVVDVKSTRMPDGALLQVGKTTEDRAAIMQRFRAAAAGITIAVLALGIGGGLLLAVWALRPLRQIIDTVRAIDAGAMSARVPRRQTGDELDELGGLFNSMLDRIATLIAGMRGSLDTVAHDLRTPVTRLRGVAELALRSDQRETLQQALADCIEESDQLLTMLNTLMDISEAETGTLKLALEPVNVSTIVEAAVDLYRHVAEDKQIVVSTASDPELRLMADRSRLRQVLANLLDNAIKYTPAGGHVDVEATRQQNLAVISVRDTGIGVMAHEMPRIWDRLYRGAHGRAERGLGLGLSLVRAIVMAHGGRVDVATASGGGAVFTIQLPVSGTG